MSYIYSNKQDFNDFFVPLKSSKGRQVKITPSTQSFNEITGYSPRSIQFTQCGPRNFNQVIKNIRINMKIINIITLASKQANKKNIYYKDVNNGITRCNVTLNGSNSLSLPLTALAPIYNSYNKQFEDSDDYIRNTGNIYLSRATDGETGTTITDTLNISSPIYHPWLCAPYLGGINNMDIQLEFSPDLLMFSDNVEAVTANIQSFNISISEISLTYELYDTNIEQFNILLPYFKIFQQDLPAATTSISTNVRDTKTAPHKIFNVLIGKEADYSNSLKNKDVLSKSGHFERIDANINNIGNAFNSDDVRVLYNLSKDAGYRKPFSRFVDDSITYVDVVSSGASAGTLSTKTIQAIYPLIVSCFDITNIDVDIGTQDLFRYEANVNVTTSTYNRTLYTVYMYSSLFVSTRERSDFITAESIENKDLLTEFDYDDFDDYYGFGFFDKLKNGLSKAYKFVKDNKIISKAAPLAAQVAGMVGGPYGPGLASGINTAGKVANTLGFGESGCGARAF